MRILSIEARPWTLPLLAPFAVSQRTAYEAHNVLVIVRTDGPLRGLGAACPVAYVTGETVSSAATAIIDVADRFVGSKIDRLGPPLRLAAELLPESPAARAGLEMALYDIWGKRWNMPLWHYFGGRAPHLYTDLTIPITPPDEAGRLAEKAAEEGFRHLKIKVGDPGGPDADLARIEAVHRAAPEASLRIDANQAFAPDAAVAFVGRVKEMGADLELVEQPVRRDDIAGLKYVRDHIDTPVFADEAVCTPQDALRLIRAEAVRGINVKLMKSGIRGALDIISLCRTAGMRLMVGCMLETPLGIAAAAQIAAGTGAFAHVDLDAHRLIAPAPGLSGGFTEDGHRLHVGQSESGGWGVTLDETASLPS
jgi:L-alanine-DL-glutamate epimerase-like enolase superfamily enzyme